MFDHRNYASNGFYPGLYEPFSAANNGILDKEVIITPVIRDTGGGGGWVPSLSGKPDRYRVEVKLRYNGKEYIDSKIVDDNEARIIAELHGVTKFETDKVIVIVNGVQKFEPIITVNTEIK